MIVYILFGCMDNGTEKVISVHSCLTLAERACDERIEDEYDYDLFAIRQFPVDKELDF
jgi:hypothetical protein